MTEVEDFVYSMASNRTKRRRLDSPQECDSLEPLSSEPRLSISAERHPSSEKESTIDLTTGSLSRKALPILELLADGVLDYLSNVTLESLSDLTAKPTDENSLQYHHWYSAFINALKCHGILSISGKMNRAKVKGLFVGGACPIIPVAVVVASISKVDTLVLSDLWQDIPLTLAGPNGNLDSWQIELATATLAVVNDASMQSEDKHSLFTEEDFIPNLEQKLRSSGSEDKMTLQSSSTERFLQRCAQMRTDWLKPGLQGERAEIPARNRLNLLSQLQKSLVHHIMPFAKGQEVLLGDKKTRMEPIRSDLDNTVATVPAIEDSGSSSEYTDEHFPSFLKRQEAAMKLALERNDRDATVEQTIDDGSKAHSPKKDKPQTLVASSTTTTQHSNKTDNERMHLNQSHQPAPLKVASPTTSSLRGAYDDARLAAHTRALQRKRPMSPANPSNRKVWSTEEENALMDGLEYVRGPHWRDILALYGEGGSINEVLKNRSQVQLKDKARNMKLFFVKNGLEVPEILKAVTGELKKPKTAEKDEGEETDRDVDTVLHNSNDVSDTPQFTDIGRLGEHTVSMEASLSCQTTRATPDGIEDLNQPLSVARTAIKA